MNDLQSCLRSTSVERVVQQIMPEKM